MESKPSDRQEPREKITVAPKETHSLRFFLVAGFSRGWFAFSTREEPLTHKVDIDLTVDTDKVKHDTKKAAETTKREAAELSAKVKEEAKQLRRQSN
jgi:hypothetical protein